MTRRSTSSSHTTHEMELADRAIFPPNTTHISSDDVGLVSYQRQDHLCFKCCGSCDVMLPISCCGFSLFAAFWALSDSLWEQEAVSSMLPKALLAAALLSVAVAECVLLFCRLKLGVCERPKKSKLVRSAPSRFRALRALYRCRPFAGWACRLTFEVLGGLATFFLLAGLVRAFGPMHLDDVHPLGCAYLDGFMAHSHAKYLWIIPIQHDHHNGNVSVPISENRSWCEEMMRLQEEEGYILGMHGAHHDWHELDTPPDHTPTHADHMYAEFQGLNLTEARSRIELGLSVWADAFNGSQPTHFSFPGQWGSKEVVSMLRDEYGFTYVRSLYDGLIGRIYHCDDSFCQVTCKAWFLDLW